jgi:hypothetical protein
MERERAMPTEPMPDDPRALWQRQPTEEFRLSPAELRAMVARSHRTLRRMTVAMYAGPAVNVVLCGVGLVAFTDPLMRAGIVLVGLAFVQLAVALWRTRLAREAARLTPHADPSILSYRADLLRHRALNGGRQLWLRFALGIPGGALFFLGFARAFPALARYIYMELALFLVVMPISFLLLRRRGRTYQRQIDELDALRRPS